MGSDQTMSLKKWNEKIESSDLYKFSQRHKKVIMIVEGLIIIGLLVAINMYIVKDYSIKKQIKDNCGYTTNNYECICEKNFVENWKELQRGGSNITLNFLEEDIDVKLDG